MIPRKHLLHVPDKYQPLGSVKSVRNLASEPDFGNIDINALFMSSGNMTNLIHSLYKVARQNGSRSTIHKFKRLVPLLAKQWMRSNNLELYETVDQGTTSVTNWVEIIGAINNKFMSHCYQRLQWNTFVPTREWAEVGPRENRVQKRFHEITAADVGTLDVWRRQEIQISNSHFRNNNAIPFWQTSMHTRHYDRQNEGLAHDDSNRASLDTPIYGYSMTNIESRLDKWHSSEWFGM